jgi:hypothetical protein
MLHVNSQDLRMLWERICVALPQRYAYLNDRPMEPRPNEPATQDDLLALERHWGFALPPSYRMLLSLFDGAQRFAYTTPLLSAREIIEGDNDWDVVDELAPQMVPYVFAGGAGDLFFAFDPDAVAEDGEREVVVFTSDGGEERHPNIVVFMERYLDALLAGIERERADRDGIE